MTRTGRGDWRRSLAGEHGVGLGALVFAFLGPPVAWSLHFGLVYFLDALFCTAGWSWTAGRVAVGLATVAFAAVSAAGGWVGWRTWRRRRAGESWEEATVRIGGAADFFLVTGALGAVLFTALIVAEALPVFFAPFCPEVVP